ncbi:hypothetical protein B0T14DRAFT_424099 [Immersiella caudata]|uniref:Zn(2)-C6 fungal-type domain-containing protein n=1 Tax=Immersiella caudata TaxID=314043 RepID=A0AA39X2M9_9PEZI|nr:hypothetical protein B0T14DRAFT_424099 [Immersiella caudata]
MEGNDASRPYHPKRPHRKSRAGCISCKTRKVKCDEARPTCRNCTLRREKCVYVNKSPPSKAASLASAELIHHTGLAFRSHDTPASTPSPGPADVSNANLIYEPMYMPAGRNINDMKLLWHFTTTTHSSLNSWTGAEPRVTNVLRHQLLEHALDNPFLLDGVLGLTAMQMNFVGQSDVSPSLAALYRARAMCGYRAAIEAADPATFPALLVSSIVVCGLSSAEFRGPDAKPLFVLDWLTVWRGIGLIIQLTQLRSVADSSLVVLFYRPQIDLDETPIHLPSNLLFMISSIRAEDPDYPHVKSYYTFLKYLGGLYRGLATEGFGPLLNLRITTFLSFSTVEFIELARQRRSRAAIIIAHYLVFVKLIKKIWWMSDISDSEIRNISGLVGLGPLSEFMRVPKAALGVEDDVELARILLQNPTWEPPRQSDKAITWPLGDFVDQDGKPVEE